ncbi:MAG: hypothetical protein AAGU17_00610 [Anaerolineaceae bacterium]
MDDTENTNSILKGENMAPEKKASAILAFEGNVGTDIIVEMIEMLKATRIRNAELEAENNTLSELVNILAAQVIRKQEKQ